MNYKVTNYTADIKTPQIQFADVVEVPTNVVVKHQLPVPKARDLAWKLNHGRGFNGWTPAFFLETISLSAFGDDEVTE